MYAVYITEEFYGLLLGERGYESQLTLLTPDPEPGIQQNFNVADGRMRAQVEIPAKSLFLVPSSPQGNPREGLFSMCYSL